MLNGAFFPLRYIFSRVANSQFLSFFSFLLLQFFDGVWLYVFTTADAVYGEQQQDCFVWLKGRLPSTLPHLLPPSPPTKKWQNVVIEGNTQAARRCVYADANVGINFIISSATAYLSSRGFSYISQLDGERLAGLPKPHFTASLNLWPSMMAFKAVKPQRPSLSFIIYVCGLRKKVNVRWKLPQRNSDRLGLVLDILTRHGNAFFDLFSVIALSVHVLYCSLFSSWYCSFPLSPLYCSFFRPSLFGRLFVSLFFAPWDLVPACFTSLTMKQMLILIILLAEISLWSNLMPRKQLLYSASEGGRDCACKCDLTTKAMQDTPLESCYT